MAKRSKITPEQQEKMLLESSIKDMEEKISFGQIYNPTRFFSVGERVLYGAHKETFIEEIRKDGLYYIVLCKNVKRDRNKPAKDELHVCAWQDVFPYSSTKPTSFRKEETYQIVQANASIDSLLRMIYHSGIDFDVEYQREHVWELNDKVNLIDSIFNNIDIGKFVFVQRNFSVIGKLYEIIDGKQRLTAIREFYEDRFKYNDYYFSELSYIDKNKFWSHSITYGYITDPSIEIIYNVFIKLNTCGKPMNNKHIDKVKKLLEKEMDNV